MRSTRCASFAFFLMWPPPLRSTLFPYTTLFRSDRAAGPRLAPHGHVTGVRAVHVPQLRQRERRSEEHTSELQSRQYLVCRLLLEKKKNRLLIALNPNIHFVILFSKLDPIRHPLC